MDNGYFGIILLIFLLSYWGLIIFLSYFWKIRGSWCDRSVLIIILSGMSGLPPMPTFFMKVALLVQSWESVGVWGLIGGIFLVVGGWGAYVWVIRGIMSSDVIVGDSFNTDALVDYNLGKDEIFILINKPTFLFLLFYFFFLWVVGIDINLLSYSISEL